MNEDIVNRVKEQLNAEFCFMNNDWLHGCVEYFIAEGQSEQPNLKTVLEFVRAQWLLSDLKEINTANAILPEDLAAKKLIVLPGSYMLQVNEMIDIGQSKYKQLQAIRKVNTFNLEVTEDDNIADNGWEPRVAAKRMIQLKMTDGVQDIVGMEHCPIPLLNEMLLPGYKVLIKGPVKCRNGVLFLNEGNIEGKGGEVDRLLIPNAVENLLARAVKKPENPDPYNDNPTTNQPIVNAPPQNQDANVQNLLADEDFDVNMDEIANIENSDIQHARPNNSRPAGQPNQRAQERSVTNESSSSTAIANNASIDLTEEEMQREYLAENSWFLDDAELMMQAEQQYLEMERRERAQMRRDRYGEEEDEDAIMEECGLPYITEPGGEDDDTFAVCNDIDLTSMTIGPTAHTSKEKNRSSIDQKASTSKNTNTSGKRSSQSSKQHKSKQHKSKQYSFLCDILFDEIIGTKIIDVKAHISKMTRLTKENSSWIFNCTIADDTGGMNVSFTNEVLEKIIGLSVKEFSQKKKKKKDPKIYQELQRVLRRAEFTLQAINILKIQIKQGKKPEVVEISELTETQKATIEERLNQ